MNKTNFYTYLLNKPLTKRVAEQHEKNIRNFEKWCAKNLFPDPWQLNYKELLRYVKHLKEKELNPHTINVKIDSIRKYYDYLTEQGTREDNPAKNIRVKGMIYTVRKDVLKPEQIQKFYRQYSNKEDFSHPLNRIGHNRNIIILSLIIHQAATTGEINRIETKDINLEEGTIYIPATENINGRTLELHASQIMPMNNYLDIYRPLLGPKDEKLIPEKVQTLAGHMFKQIRKKYPYITNALQLRASVIMQWVRQHNIRQVQYMCGHKHISTTERYKQQDMEGLQNELAKHHPFS